VAARHADRDHRRQEGLRGKYLEDWQREFSNFLWIDVEASGLHAGSFPVEIGWCGPDLVSTSFLIRPIPEKWTIYEWSPSSEKVHGIGWNHINDFGHEATDVSHWLNAACHGKTVFSDNPEFDAAWLLQLFHDTGVKQQFTLHDAAQLERQAVLASRLAPEEAQSYVERVKARFPHPHRAGPDSRREAAKFLVLAMPHLLQEIEAMA